MHDVQHIIGEEPTWWWDPLSFVHDMETAEKMADVFITSATAAGSKQDAYFESAGRETLSRLMLAAALGGLSVRNVFAWANDPDSRPGAPDDPAQILSENGQTEQGRALRQTQNLTEKQRDGVYGTLRPWISVLGNTKVLPWITDETRSRPHFDPDAFVRSTDTIYLISKEGGGSARAITGALTMAILMAAERYGSTQAGGRLPTPLMAVLDEAANVCRWRELPDVYSHYGSRGIIMSAFFQSWAQGVEAFGETGMSKLWSAANIRVAGAGLAEDKFLPFLASLIGDHDVVKRSSSSQSKGRSVTTSLQRERILDTADLTAMPRGPRGTPGIRDPGDADQAEPLFQAALRPSRQRQSRVLRSSRGRLLEQGRRLMDAIERDDDDIEVVETTYANVAEFVEQFLLPTYRRTPRSTAGIHGGGSTRKSPCAWKRSGDRSSTSASKDQQAWPSSSATTSTHNARAHVRKRTVLAPRQARRRAHGP